jgi:hypothetical protein
MADFPSTDVMGGLVTAGEALKLKVMMVFSGSKKDAESRLWEPGAS